VILPVGSASAKLPASRETPSEPPDNRRCGEIIETPTGTADGAQVAGPTPEECVKMSAPETSSTRSTHLTTLAVLALLAAAAATAHAAPREGATPRFLTGPQPGEPLELALAYLHDHRAELGLTDDDLAEVVVEDRYQTRHNGVTHLYLRQRLGGIEVWNGDVNVNVAADGSIVNLGSSFVPDLASAADSRSPALDPGTAVLRAAAELGIDVDPIAADGGPTLLSSSGGPALAAVYAGDGISRDEIPVELAYLGTDDGKARLCWRLVIRRLDTPDWWDLLVDATTGEVLARSNWTDYGAVPQDVYLVYPIPFASPDETAQTAVTGPATPAASPFGWHDDDGDADPDYTDTRGNNVFAQEDTDGNNSGGFRPSGGAGPLLDFSYPFDPALQPDEGTNLEAAVVNLFYWNNVMHDLTHGYGFDEAAGNFQVNNYGNGGSAGDPVQADALDGSGNNNANFSTPPDGFDPRMQMFRFLAPPTVTVDSPAAIAGDYPAAGASFGATLDEVGISGDLSYVDDGVAGAGGGTVNDGCEALTAGSLDGLVALVDRGFCEFGVKVLNAENAGAIAAIVVNNQGEGLVSMGPGQVGNQVTIPSAFIGQSDGDTIKGQLPSPGVTVTLSVTDPDRDSDLDNQIIVHEYGHGISNRLTGGPSNSNCLNGSEQAGEGWSDFWSLVLTAKVGDSPEMARGIGTYANFEPVDGSGIRNFPYSTDMAVNPQTYATIASTNVPHGVGEVWMAMVWEVYWNLVTAYGFDEDLYTGTGGNNLTIQLVIDGMKLQPCNPTFVEARDAILLADQVNNGGVNQCAIWRGFAKRGLGVSAVDGGANVGDEVEAFDVPEECMPLFADGFESGDLSAWSLSVP